MANEIISAIIQGVATIIGAAGAVFFAHKFTSGLEKQKHQIEKDLAFRQLFNDFNFRFDRLNGSLNEILKKQKDTPFDSLTPKQQDKIQDYINLCSEEFLWYRKDRIEKEIWEAWKLGLSYYLKAAPIAELFKRERDGIYSKSYYEGFFREIDNILP